MYINKPIEYKNTGVSPAVWALDIKSVNFGSLPIFNLIMKGFSSPEKYQEFIDNPNDNDKYFIDVKFVDVSSEDLELNGTVGYPNIPTLYNVLTTKTVEVSSVNEDGETVTETQPAYPFFGGEVINNQ